MKTMKTLMTAAAMVALSGTVSTAQAALISVGGGMIYDSTRDITWLADMNYAFTSGYVASGVAPGSAFDPDTIWTDGRMGWNAANTWANNLVYGGFDDWRLPTLNSADTTCSNNFNPGGGFSTQYFGTGCTGGELSGLFVTDLGNKPFESVLNQTGDTAEQIANLALFSNVQSYCYWSGTEYAPDPSGAWCFDAFIGYQNVGGKRGALYAVAVRPGDVRAAQAVPEPGTLALLLAAVGVGAVVRRRRAH